MNAKNYCGYNSCWSVMYPNTPYQRELETMVDTNDEWIKSRTGVEERRISKRRKQRCFRYGRSGCFGNL